MRSTEERLGSSTPAARAATTTAVVLALLVGLLVAVGLPAPAAEAGSRRQPGNLTGFALDTCDAPSQRAMNRWRTRSKYHAVGIYIAGMNRACSSQPNLTRRWVRTQMRKGWRLLPLSVGRQASCSPAGYYLGKRISADPDGRYARARGQGRSAATSAVQAARRLGIPRRSVLWFDLEHFDVTRTRCRLSALWFTSAWTRQLHRQRYRSGFYSSASSGIRMLDDARRATPRRYDLPDYLWIAEWNGQASVRSAYISREGWWPHRRVHQYRGGHDETHGGVRLNIDSNFLSTGRGTRGGPAARHCGVRVGFRSYPTLARGDRGRKVRAAQCLLRQADRYAGRLDGRYDRGVARAVRRYQRTHDALRASGVLKRPTWGALLSRGGTPLVKYGSGGNAVRRLQRSLNALTGARLRVDGVFARAEHRAVRQYQRRTGRARTGVVTARTWQPLRHGRVARRWSEPRARAAALSVPPRWTGVPFSSGALGPGFVVADPRVPAR